jgi:hypothetical protein
MAFIAITVDASDLKAKRDALANLFDKPGLAATLEEALERAIWPAYLRLREVTPVGPTGNLKRAVAYKTVKYPKDGAAVGLIGYNRAGTGKSSSSAGGSVRAGKDRAFHQWWVEYGTKDRVIAKKSDTPYQRKAHTRRMKSGKVANITSHQVSGQNAYIASSYNRLGPFRVVKNENGNFATDPAYPRAFFKKSKTPIRIPAMPAGGAAGLPPVQTAWNQTRNQVAEILQRELSVSLEAALAKITSSSTGSVSGAVIQAGG